MSSLTDRNQFSQAELRARTEALQATLEDAARLRKVRYVLIPALLVLAYVSFDAASTGNALGASGLFGSGLGLFMWAWRALTRRACKVAADAEVNRKADEVRAHEAAASARDEELRRQVRMADDAARRRLEAEASLVRLPREWLSSELWKQKALDILADPNVNGEGCPHYLVGTCLVRLRIEANGSAGPEACSMYEASVRPSYRSCELFQVSGAAGAR